MTIFDNIKTQQIAARKAKDTIAASALTTLMGSIQALAKNDGNREPTDQDALKVLKQFADKVAESFTLGGHLMTVEQKDKLNRELAIYQSFRPTMLSREDLTAIIREQVDLGGKLPTIMAHLKTHHTGLYDGQMASEIIKSLT